MSYIVWVLRASCSLSYELRRKAVELILKYCTLPLNAGVHCKAFSLEPENGQFLGKTLSILSQKLGKK